MNQKIRIAIAEDHELVRKGFVSLLNMFESIETAIEAENGLELLEKLKHQTVDLVFLDVSMPVMDGYDTLKALKQEFLNLPVIILSLYFDGHTVESFINSGAAAFMSKDSKKSQLEACIQSVLKYGKYHENIEKLLSDYNRLKRNSTSEELTQREYEVLMHLQENLTNKEIAAKLKINVRTVEGYRGLMQQKTKTKNLAALITSVKRLYPFRRWS